MSEAEAFEIAQPVQEVAPQWIQFIHKVNELDAVWHPRLPLPFGDPARTYKDGDLYLEIYGESQVIQATRDNGTEEGVGLIRFEAFTDRMRVLFAEAASQFNEANKQLIDGKYWGQDTNPGAYYARGGSIDYDGFALQLGIRFTFGK